MTFFRKSWGGAEATRVEDGWNPGRPMIRKRSDPRAARWAAWGLVGAYFVLAGTGLFLMVLSDTTPGDVPFPIILFILALAVVGILPVIGALVITHHPRHPVGWLMFATFPLVALDMFANGYVSYATSAVPGSLPIQGILLVWLNWSGAPLVTFTFTLMNLLFPSGRLLSPRWRTAAWTSGIALLGFLFLQAVKPGPLGLVPRLDNPYAVTRSAWALPAIVETVGQALKLPFVEITLRHNE